jgi:hypothetical protein
MGHCGSIMGLGWVGNILVAKGELMAVRQRCQEFEV